MLFGYARVLTLDQTSALQLDALHGPGCERVFSDECVSRSARTLPQLGQALTLLKPGDVLMVWKLDRLGRSLSHLIELTSDLGQRGVGFWSLSETIDTTGAQGKLLLHMLGDLAEFERSLIAERTRAGVVAAKQRGTKLCRKLKLSTAQIAHARQLIDAGESHTDVARTMDVSTATLYRAIPAGASNRNNDDLFGGLAS